MNGLRARLAGWIGGKSWTHSFARVPLMDGGGGGARLGQPYANSVWVMRAIKFCVDPIKGLPLQFSVDRRGGDVALENPELTAFWERPAVNRGGPMNRAQLIEATGGWIKLAGEAFWVLDDSWDLRSGLRSRIRLVRPGDMRPILGGDRELIGWRLRDARGSHHNLIPASVIHFRCWNPYDEIRGLAEWEAAKIAADADYAANVFQRNLMRNNGDRGPIIASKEGGMLTQEQIDQITAQLRQKQELARQGIFRGVFLSGDVEVKDPAVQSVDAGYVAQRMENRHEVFLAFGVPPSMASLVANYSVGSASDRFKLIEETCMPLADMIAEGIEEVSARFLGTGETVFAEFDWDEHSTMQQVRRETIDSMAKLTSQGMPARDAGEYLRMKLPRFPGDEVGRIPYNLVEIGGEDSMEVPPPPAADDEEDEEADELKALFAARAARARRPAPEPEARAAEQSPERVALWQRIHRNRAPWEKRFEKKIGRLLFAARAETLRNIETARQLEGKSIEHRAAASDLIFELVGWLADWTKELLGISRSALERAGFELWTEELGKDDPLTMPAKEVMDALADRENKIKGAGEKVWEKVRREIEQALLEGETMDEIEGRVKRAFRSINDTRARAIAVTETTVAYEAGRDMTFRAAGVEWTEWVHSGLAEGARPKHQAADGQRREMGEPFDIGGIPMLYPGDPEAPASEVINCRCVRIAVAGPDTGDIVGNDDQEDIPY